MRRQLRTPNKRLARNSGRNIYIYIYNIDTGIVSMYELILAFKASCKVLELEPVVQP